MGQPPRLRLLPPRRLLPPVSQSVGPSSPASPALRPRPAAARTFFRRRRPPSGAAAQSVLLLHIALSLRPPLPPLSRGPPPCHTSYTTMYNSDKKVAAAPLHLPQPVPPPLSVSSPRPRLPPAPAAPGMCVCVCARARVLLLAHACGRGAARARARAGRMSTPLRRRRCSALATLGRLCFLPSSPAPPPSHQRACLSAVHASTILHPPIPSLRNLKSVVVFLFACGASRCRRRARLVGPHSASPTRPLPRPGALPAHHNTYRGPRPRAPTHSQHPSYIYPFTKTPKPFLSAPSPRRAPFGCLSPAGPHLSSTPARGGNT